MLEATAHLQLKELLRREGGQRWPHHLTLCRLVGRSLRRGDHTLIRLAPGTDPSWLIGLLVPLSLAGSPLALVLEERLRQRLLQVEWPRLRAAGLDLRCWEGEEAPPDSHLWMLDHRQLLKAWRDGRLGERQLVIPQAERLEGQLREAMALRLEPCHWDSLRRALPAAEPSLLELHGRISRRVLAQPRHPEHLVRLMPEEEAPLRQLLHLLRPLPEPWSAWIQASGPGWTSWAVVDPGLLQWQWHRQPLDPLAELEGLLEGRGVVMVGEIPHLRSVADHGRDGSGTQTTVMGLQRPVEVDLGDPPLADPLPLYCPQRQPLPNNPQFADHLLDHCRRLVLGQAGLTLILLDDPGLRLGLASALAAEFGSRVVHASTAPEVNGVVCASWGWWLANQERLPLPDQVVVALLPIASLEDPLTAARVEGLRREGGDWFRNLLLPEAISRLQRGVAGLRRHGGRLAVLDGRLRGRAWGQSALAALEPWVPLLRLLPD